MAFTSSDERPERPESPDEKRALLARLLRQRLRPPKLTVPSFAQERMWFLEKWSDGSPAFNMPVAVRLEGELDAEALARSLETICRRHETLRTTFTTDGDGRLWQVVASEPHVELARLDCAAGSDDATAARARQHIAALAKEPFDLEHGPLCRLTLLRHSPRRHDLLVNMHHLISDAWSLAVFVGELGALYRAATAVAVAVTVESSSSSSGDAASTLPPLPLQYASFATWQRARFSGTGPDAELDYWRARLDANAVLELPADHPRPRTARAHGARRSVWVAAPAVRGVHAFAHEEKTTPFVVVLAAFKALLARTTGQTDIVVGTLVAGRTRADLEGLIGLFLNSLALRTSLAGRPSFRALVRRVHETAIGGFAHQEVPFERLVDALAPVRQSGRLPLFQVMFIFQNAPRGSLSAPGLVMDAQPVETATTKHDLTLIAAEEPDGRLRLTAEYATDLFDADTIVRLLGHLERLLVAGCSSPDGPERPVDELSLLSAAERCTILDRGNGPPAPAAADACVHALIEAQVDRTPDATAVSFAGRALSYRELDRRANQLAHWLRALAVGPRSRVGICLERSPAMVVALLATLKAGGAYVPLDPAYPAERLAAMLEDAAPAVVIVQERLRDRLPASTAEVAVLDDDEDRGWRALDGRPDTRPAGLAAPEDLAYVIFTSGSTGRPKGAMNEHRAVSNRLLWMQEAYRLGEADVVLQKTPTGFDVSVWELFWPLIVGARLVVAVPGGHQDPAYLVDCIAAEGVTTAHFVPSMLRVFLDEPGLGRCASLRRIVCSGEALGVDLAERCLERLPRAALENLYGPTEAAVDVTHHTCVAGEGRRSIPIGRPIAGAVIRLLDANLELVPAGVPGELYIGGVPVGRGYLGRPGLTADRFVPDPMAAAPGARLYRTGDLARWLPDGALEYLGRTDFQVKLRGVRIELAEIELMLEQHPAVAQAAVVAIGERAEDVRLVAYVVARAGGTAEARALARHLKSRLPEHMVPSAFVVLPAMPLTPSGKLDRRALPAPDADTAGRGQPFVAPRDELERKLAAIWEELLGVRPVGIRHDFFALGGHSLLAARLAVRIERALGRRLPLPFFFERPTVEGLAAAIRDGAAPRSSLLRVKAGAPGAAPLFLVHGAGGSALAYASLARHLAPDRPLYALHAPDEEPALPTTLEAMAAEYLERVRAVAPGGPYLLGGWSFGGVVAFEMAAQLAAAGAPVGLLAIVDSRAPLAAPRPLPDDIWLVAGFAAALGVARADIGRALDGAGGLGGRELLGHVLGHVLGRAGGDADLDLDEAARRFARFRRDIEAWSRYAARPYPGNAVFLHAAAHDAWNAGTAADWSRWIGGGLTVREIPGDHFSLLRPPHVATLAEALTEHLDRLELEHGLRSKHR